MWGIKISPPLVVLRTEGSHPAQVFVTRKPWAKVSAAKLSDVKVAPAPQTAPPSPSQRQMPLRKGFPIARGAVRMLGNLSALTWEGFTSCSWNSCPEGGDRQLTEPRWRTRNMQIALRAYVIPQVEVMVVFSTQMGELQIRGFTSLNSSIATVLITVILIVKIIATTRTVVAKAHIYHVPCVLGTRLKLYFRVHLSYPGGRFAHHPWIQMKTLRLREAR